jgi:aminopeptidase N
MVVGTYLALAAAMGGDLDARIWEQIAAALSTIEYDERGTPGHNAFAAYARSILQRRLLPAQRCPAQVKHGH